jgi:hypothetical protein
MTTTEGPSAIRVVRLECWHANELIYQADGETEDGRHVFVHFRPGRFSVWVGDGPIDDLSSTGEFVIDGEDRPGATPDTLTRATIAEWTRGRFEWPARIDGYHNEPDGDAGASPGR